jgi:hypothetical protein
MKTEQTLVAEAYKAMLNESEDFHKDFHRENFDPQWNYKAAPELIDKHEKKFNVKLTPHNKGRYIVHGEKSNVAKFLVHEFDGDRDEAEGEHPEAFRKAHIWDASPEDRGAADSFYGRGKKPHKLIRGNKETVLTDAEIRAYHRGYDDNEEAKIKNVN